MALPVPLPRLYDYLPPPSGPVCKPGARVTVPFGKRKLVGIVVEEAESSELPYERLAGVIGLPDQGEVLLNSELRDLLSWCSHYYKHSIGEVVAHALPPALRSPGGSLPEDPVAYAITGEGHRVLETLPGNATAQKALLSRLLEGPQERAMLAECGASWRAALSRLVELGAVREQSASIPAAKPRPGPELTDEQSGALETISAGLSRFHCHLLDGVTGSGKTEVYLRLIESVLLDGLQVMLLVPEIGLTPQLLKRVTDRLGLQPSVVHSRVSAAQRLLAWNDMRTGRSRLLIGTRSALFTPLVQPGLIILDEEHDASFKQQDGFRYSARDVAVKRAASLDIPIVLGSATPSLESFRNAIEGRYSWSRMRARATKARMPVWQVLDMRQQAASHGVAETALSEAKSALERGEQVMVFLNRRGYSPVLMCTACSWQADCDRCDAHLTWHRSVRALFCHHCGAQRPVPQHCPACLADALEGIGEGTQRLEEMLEKRFAPVPVLRFDADRTARKGAMEDLLRDVKIGDPCLLVGTQMLAKGHHFPAVTLVIVVGMDQALYSADYRALERMGQLLQQVAGRAGREDKPGKVILQTLHPEHEAFQLLLSEGYESYARWLLADRQSAGLPPYRYQALLRSDAHGKPEVHEFLETARGVFPGGSAEIFGPLPALMERRGGRFRMYLVVNCDSRQSLHRQLDEWLPRIRNLPQARKVRWAIDVDPQEL